MTCPVGTDVKHAADILRAGGLVAFATETVYGLGANALDAAALAHVFDVKQRPKFDPIIAHVARWSDVAPLVRFIPEQASLLAQRFWPGPLTIVFEKSDLVPDLLTAGLPTVAVRIPSHPLALELIGKAQLPIAAPSANVFGSISPTTAAHVAEQLGDRIDYILDGGPCRVGVESTVIDLTGSRAVLLRPGGLPVEEIESVIGPVLRPDPFAHADAGPRPAPGMMSRHYAPCTPLEAATTIGPVHANERVGLLTWKPCDDVDRFAAVVVLSPTGNLREAAANFFAALRTLDSLGLDRILALEFPDEGLGLALNDRLRRAATQ